MNVTLTNRTASGGREKEIVMPKVTQIVILDGPLETQVQLKGETGGVQTLTLPTAERWTLDIQPDRTMGGGVAA